MTEKLPIEKRVDTLELKLDKAIQVIEELSYGMIILDELYFEKLKGGKDEKHTTRPIRTN